MIEINLRDINSKEDIEAIPWLANIRNRERIEDGLAGNLSYREGEEAEAALRKEQSDEHSNNG
jgi:hypothetical protein